MASRSPTLVERAARGMRVLTGASDRASYALAASLVTSTAEAICAFDMGMRVIEWNPAMARLTGVPRERAVGRHGLALEITADWTAPGGAWARALGGHETALRDEPWGRRWGNTTTFVEGTIAPLRSDEGAVLGGVMTLRDVSDRVQAAEMLRASEARFRNLFDRAAVGIVVLDVDGVVRDVNPAFERLLGYAAAELVGRRAGDLSPPEDAHRTREPVREVYAGRRRSASVETRMVRRDGEVRWVNFSVSRFEGYGAREAVVGMAHDVTERKTLETQLAHQAYHDALTGLANRALFGERVAQALEVAGEHRDRVAVIYCDLDGFKRVNDSLGHEAGDTLLKVTGERLLNATRGCDTVARLGGDEFAVLMGNVRAADDPLVVAGRIVDALRQAVKVGGAEVHVGGSVGVARAEPGDDAAALLRNADMAMYQAKQAGKGRVALFETGMHSAAMERLELEGGLRHAAERGELRLRFQPIVELAGEAVTGVEALVRWDHPERGLLSPATFLQVAEETGIIVALGRWVLGEALRQAAAWDAALRARGCAEPAFTVTVNVSGRQLHDAQFMADVATALAQSGFPAGRVLLEITETVWVEQDEGTVARLRALKMLGVRLAIDDFGTGYSSLAYLQRFPLDVIKIDKRFVDGVAREGGSDAACTRAILGLGAMLGLEVVAEGIARPQQQERLLALGCRIGQGFLFAEPLDPAHVERLLAERGAAAGVLAARAAAAA
jgi:diguanylate cyclase (GGDEF)-like protein/PAS domain S-box-containing protein